MTGSKGRMIPAQYDSDTPGMRLLSGLILALVRFNVLPDLTARLENPEMAFT